MATLLSSGNVTLFRNRKGGRGPLYYEGKERHLKKNNQAADIKGLISASAREAYLAEGNLRPHLKLPVNGGSKGKCGLERKKEPCC